MGWLEDAQKGVGDFFNGVGETVSGAWNTIGEGVHLGLDALGFVPVFGAAADGLNAGIYALEGDAAMAGISLACAIPFAGDAVAAGKLAVKGGMKVGELATKTVGKEAVKEGAEVLAKDAAKEGAEAAVKGSTEALKSTGSGFKNFLKGVEAEQNTWSKAGKLFTSGGKMGSKLEEAARWGFRIGTIGSISFGKPALRMVEKAYADETGKMFDGSPALYDENGDLIYSEDGEQTMAENNPIYGSAEEFNQELGGTIPVSVDGENISFVGGDFDQLSKIPGLSEEELDNLGENEMAVMVPDVPEGTSYQDFMKQMMESEDGLSFKAVAIDVNEAMNNNFVPTRCDDYSYEAPKAESETTQEVEGVENTVEEQEQTMDSAEAQASGALSYEDKMNNFFDDMATQFGMDPNDQMMASIKSVIVPLGAQLMQMFDQVKASLGIQTDGAQVSEEAKAPQQGSYEVGGAEASQGLYEVDSAKREQVDTSLINEGANQAQDSYQMG